MIEAGLWQRPWYYPKEGETLSDLRPSGWITVDSQRVFVVSEGDFIEKNCKVKVLSVDGNRVVVKK